jgi:hypothetical protein
VFDAKKINHHDFESKDEEKVMVLLQVHEIEKDLVKDTLIKSLVLQDTIVTKIRWEEIYQKI